MTADPNARAGGPSAKLKASLVAFPIPPIEPAGVLDFHAGDGMPLFPKLTLPTFTRQLSDHLPLWVRINADNDGQQLDQLIRGRLKSPKRGTTAPALRFPVK